jgi:hypothetical protein
MIKKTAHHPSGKPSVAPKSAGSTPLIAANTVNANHLQITNPPNNMLSIRIPRLNRIASKNGRANTSAITILAATIYTIPPESDGIILEIAAGNSSYVNNCVTTITANTAASAKLTGRMFFVFTRGGSVNETKELMSIEYAYSRFGKSVVIFVITLALLSLPRYCTKQRRLQKQTSNSKKMM